MAKEVIQSYLYETGAKFIVLDTSKDKTYSPGSTGFVSYIKSLDDNYQDVAKVSVVITRRGKGGKPRLEKIIAYQPIFIFEGENFAKLLPTEGSRKYYMDIGRDSDPIVDINDMSGLDFLGWAAAMAEKLKRMSENCKHRRWPEDKGHPVNRASWITERFNEDPDRFLTEYGDNKDFRTEFVKAFREMNSAMARIHLEFDLKKIAVEVNAAEFLVFTNKGEFIPKDAEDKINEYKFTEDTALLSRSFKYYSDIQEEVKHLYEDKQPKVTKKKKGDGEPF